MFMRTFHLSLSWARSLQSISPHPISLTSILTLYSHLRLGFPSDSFLLKFPPTSYSLRIPLLPMLATCPTKFILLDLIIVIIICENYKLWAPLYEIFSNHPFSSLLGPNIFLGEKYLQYLNHVKSRNYYLQI
jgi:hypothetical protein